jgi:heme a synthase
VSTEGGLGRVKRFERFAVLLLVYLLFVILFGAWVRVTGSGAGCGEHWPTCHGALVPRAPSQATLIEFTHRVTSGLLGIASLALPIWAIRRFPPGHAARRASVATFVLVLVEAAIGARLVLGGLVADNASVSRAVAVALHLVNTLLLTACAALTVAAARDERLMHLRSRPGRARTEPLSPGSLLSAWLLLASLVVVSASGAVTALGDTLFPVGEQRDQPVEHFLVQLRVVHPVLACGAVLLGLYVSRRYASATESRLLARFVGAASLAQLVLGCANIVLHAPGWMQLLHLLCAQLLWIAAVLLCALRWTRPEAAARIERRAFVDSS